ncbi:MAG: DUF4249 domain-containing protein [Saprospiraceae bacterium]
MHQNKHLCLLSMLVMLLSACIKSYEPDIQANDEKKYVVSGQVTAGDSIQKVNVSITSPIGAPHFIPVTGCHVKLMDDHGHQFGMSGIGKGDYTTVIDQENLKPGYAFMIEILTPDGETLISDFDTIYSAPPVDSVYFERKDIEENIAGHFMIGIQFYIDLKGRPQDSRYYKWEETETWEYHTAYPIEWYYDGIVHHVIPPDYSWNVCWISSKVPDIYTLSTANLEVNNFYKFPIHYVSNRTSRLSYGYSLLVKQYALSGAGYNYWDELRLNSDPDGGLFEKQPLAVRGNMHNTIHPENDVLGFFGAASVTQKRIFVKPIHDLPLDYYNQCNPYELIRGLGELRPADYPAYLLGNHEGYTNMVLNDECVNCLLQGGTTTKPSFWPF